MSMQTRALIIAMMGPALQAIGFVWELVHILMVHLHQPLTARHILFEPGFLLLFVGLLVTLACVPVGLEVARAQPEDVELPVFEPVQPEPRRGVEGPGRHEAY